MSDLPNGWAETSLGELTEKLVDGSHNPPSKAETGLPMLSARNVMDGKIIFDQYRFIDPDLFEMEHRRSRVTAGDVLLTIVGTIGRSAVVPEGLRDFTLQRSVAVMTPTPAVGSSYLSYFFRSADIQRWFADNAKGTAQKGVYLGALAKLTVPVAPLPEQRRIVAKVDGLAARTARARKELDRIPTLIARYKQRLLALAFSGVLTAGWRRENMVSPETHSITGLTSELDGLEYSISWTSGALLELAENHDGKRRPIKAADRALRHGDYRYYGASGVIDSIDDFLFDGDYLLIGEDGANLLSRSTPIAFLASGQFWVNNHAHILKARPVTSNAYLCWFINMINLAPYVTGSAQPKLTQANLHKIRAPLPPIGEQAEIVHRIESAFGWLDRMADDHAAAVRLLPKLDAAILGKAFQGKLVPQDPNDEPAAKLLERIKVERDAAPKEKRGRKARNTMSPKELQIMPKNLEQVLAEVGDWISAQDAFQRCGIGGAATTEEIEEIYAELRKLDKAGKIEAEPVNDDQGRKLHDRLRLKAA